MANLKDHFNSTTLRGRANVTKATYASIALLYVFYRMRKGNKKDIKPTPKHDFAAREKETNAGATSFAKCTGLQKCPESFYEGQEARKETTVAKAVATTEPGVDAIETAATKLTTEGTPVAQDIPNQLMNYTTGNGDVHQTGKNHVTTHKGADDNKKSSVENDTNHESLDEEAGFIAAFVERIYLNLWDM